MARPKLYANENEIDIDYDSEIIVKELENHNFEKEIDLVNYIVLNIDKFVNEFLDDELISFEIDMPINKNVTLAPRGRRIDLFIRCKNKIYIIETKNPKSGTENRGAIGQILDYGREFTDSKKELIIITTKFDINTARTIKYYSLPIRYIYLSKKRILEFKDEYK